MAYCSQREKDDAIVQARAQREEAEQRANEGRHYYEQMLRWVEVLRVRKGVQTSGVLVQDYERAQRRLDQFERTSLPKMTEQDPRATDDQLDRVMKTPIVDCGRQQTWDAAHPVNKPVIIPEVPTSFCSEAERAALIARLDEAARAAQDNFRGWRRLDLDLERRFKFYDPAKAPDPGLAAYGTALRAIFRQEHMLANARWEEALAQLNRVSDDQREAGRRPIVSCAPQNGQAQRQGSELQPLQQKQPDKPEQQQQQEISAPFEAPPRPLLWAPEEPVEHKTCTQIERNALLTEYDIAIREANSNVQTANAHLTALATLSNAATAWVARFDEIKTINDEIRAYQPVVNEAAALAQRIFAQRAALAAKPLDPCPAPEAPKSQAVGQPVKPVQPPVVSERKDQPPPPKETAPEPRVATGNDQFRRLSEPITVGSNGKVGSGAHAGKKAVGMLGGLVGGLLGGGGGGGGGSSGPPVAQCRIKDSEKTVFTDPGTGISLRVGAKRTGDTVVVFADVDKSPDNGTFQGGWLGDPEGAVTAPSRANICKLWGEWSLTVSWTHTEYVDGQMVSQESGGYSKAGVFSLPGVVSSDAAPQGLWKQLGFSNASHGAREVALSYKLPKAALAKGPTTLFIHVTRPSLKTVVTQPFVLLLSETAKGLTLTKAPPTAVAVDKLLQRELGAGDPQDSAAVAKALSTRYPADAGGIER